MRVFQENAETYIAKLAASINRDPTSLDTWQCMHIATKLACAEDVALHTLDPQIIHYLRESYKDVECDIIICADGDMLLVTNELDREALNNLAAAITSGFTDIVPEVHIYQLFEDWREIRAILFSKAHEVLTTESMTIQPHNFGDVSSLSGVFEAARQQRKARHPQYILIVEDDPLTRRVVANAFKGDFALVSAGTASEAIEHYLLYAPDIVFLDIGLPDASGFEVLQQILKNDDEAYVVMFSGNSYLDNVTQALSQGAAGFIAKPFKKEKLYHYIHDSALHHHKKSV